MYKFCKPFEGSWDNEYNMRLDNYRCGEVKEAEYLGECGEVYMCSHHIDENQQEALRIKAHQTKAYYKMGGDLTDDVGVYEDYLNSGENPFEMKRGK